MRANNEPEPVNSDGDHSQGGHEGGQARNRADQSEKEMRTDYYRSSMLKCLFVTSTVYILAKYFVLGEGELFAELVQDDEGEAEAQQEVRTRQVEDEDVPPCPHGLVGDHGTDDHEVIDN